MNVSVLIRNFVAVVKFVNTFNISRAKTVLFVDLNQDATVFPGHRVLTIIRKGSRSIQHNGFVVKPIEEKIFAGCQFLELRIVQRVDVVQIKVDILVPIATRRKSFA